MRCEDKTGHVSKPGKSSGGKDGRESWQALWEEPDQGKKVNKTDGNYNMVW